jgi:hypothetical protein
MRSSNGRSILVRGLVPDSTNYRTSIKPEASTTKIKRIEKPIKMEQIQEGSNLFSNACQMLA